jgi:putative DNA methylase
VFENLNGKARLTPRDKPPKDWSPATDRTPTVWECVQHTARVLRDDERGGAEAAAKLVAAMGSMAEAARALAYRLYQISHDKGWAAEALVYNELAQDWTTLEDQAARYQLAPPMPDLFGVVPR